MCISLTGSSTYHAICQRPKVFSLIKSRRLMRDETIWFKMRESREVPNQIERDSFMAKGQLQE